MKQLIIVLILLIAIRGLSQEASNDLKSRSIDIIYKQEQLKSENEMKTVTIQKLEKNTISADQVAALLDNNKVSFQTIASLNWNEYPYHPEVSFRMAHDGTSIFLNYHIKEKSIRARYSKDNSMVWTDSCVEFFILPLGENEYYNIESNCIGTLFFGIGKDGSYREPALTEFSNQIQRWSSLGNQPFEERIGDVEWELSLIIPTSAFFKGDIKELSGQVMKGNFFKCGDDLVTPHFLSWNPINTKNPNFHLPEFFGTLIFE
ncbi:carbohydrate-binding family 9-like protein [Flavobacterium sp. ZT3R18]|uniref:carbohydrate-binding family 9-like protein n=1 Tax=Flavobacterium sp. ZT3R18 TaxID=2594429 RepID=UPI001C8F6F6F|nr:carbohydrate-binding family 9-like protein [Flavobacterium sp. ZT3R18]